MPIDTLEGVPDCGLALRDHTGHPLSPRAKADAACLDEDAITPRTRFMLQHASGMSKDEAAVSTKHSKRHCIPASSAAQE